MFRLWKWINWGLSMFRYDQFQDACSWDRKCSIWLLWVFVFPTVNVFLDGDRAGSWWKLFIFLDEAGFTVTWPRDVEEVESGPERCSLGAWPPPTECDFEGPHSKIVQRAWMCNHGFRPISLSPCIYPPTPPFLLQPDGGVFLHMEVVGSH